eukprot:TRINITY_DN425_c0_g1_i1.p1 TRINITY_DN425_c0_g1~~TRINITY_DN425_c0_g1_i1.p1  ORF type:complete len:546 (-),score=138.66 TRINITY_DN425_c0_g1_i1:312-1709(-)
MTLNGVNQMTVTVKSAPDLQDGVDESYELSVSESGSVLSANTVWGALRGLESFSQLVKTKNSQIIVENAPFDIHDAPRFSWRGLMIDTSRHFLPKQLLFHIIDSMSYNKMNALHMHWVDSQSFPIQSLLYPQLAAKGSYQYPEASYTQADIRDIVAYARLRGVRVIPEIDVPGHGGWGYGMPELIPCKGGDIMDPTMDSTYAFLGKFLGEFFSLFPDQYIHLGGDECFYSFSCWDSTPRIVQWKKDHGSMSNHDLEVYFWKRMLAEIVPGLNKTLMVWADDALSIPMAMLPANAAGEVWQGTKTMLPVTASSRKAMLSGPWYLDQQTPAGTANYLWVDTWKNFYKADPIVSGMSDAQQKLVIGGEGCMWGEQVDSFVFDERVWPRASAIAERLWSPASKNSTDEAEPRLMEWACRMQTRGVFASPIRPNFCPSDLKYHYESVAECETKLATQGEELKALKQKCQA